MIDPDLSGSDMIGQIKKYLDFNKVEERLANEEHLGMKNLGLKFCKVAITKQLKLKKVKQKKTQGYLFHIKFYFEGLNTLGDLKREENDWNA